ncbi:hypothetical protein CHLRE_02g095121v5 [Chlamydomonas reinhardtii]|uniref:RNA-binding S4 domain-containing protein n=1 Tax=Chlamydomonas reinhardtii TaxID=3055 RepID=A0A2K3E1S1_CHLRE|nr:uncharacterized protein CHLRE_02g095121v5 [Chlamydomonas reinhardtii]PNW86738.1 hypothetical protein CHLRE_02g095121v5 [Chlamydomonas reinhardtii]
MISQKQLVQTSCGQVGAAGGTTFRRLVVPVTPRLVGALRAPGKILPVAPERDGAAFGRGLSALASATGAGERSGSDGGRASSGKGASTSGSVGSDSRPRLAKVLAACGVASRRACEGLIADGRVRVNGNLVKEQGTTVDPARDKVEVFRSPDAAVAPATDGAAAAAAKTAGAKAAATATAAAAAKAAGKPAGGKAAAAAGGAVTAASASGVAGHWAVVPVRQFQDSESLYYFAVNKPKGYICTNSDPDGRAKLAVDLLAPWLSTWGRNNKDKKRLPPRLFTVGRLDVASTGLLFITNDGVWANSVMHPSSGVTKEYVVGVEEDASRQQLETLAAGTEVAGTFVSPLEVEVLGDPRRLRIVVAEGKKHEVRELVKAAGMNLLSLRRVRIGGFRLPRDLGLGGFKALTPADLKLITDARAQELASVSGATRAAAQQAAQTAATRRASVPRALRDMPEEVLEKFRKARGDKS